MKTPLITSYHSNLISAMYRINFEYRFGRIITEDAQAVSGRDFTLGVGYVYFGLPGRPVVFESRIYEVLKDVNETCLVVMPHRFFLETRVNLYFPAWQKYSLKADNECAGRKVVSLSLTPEDSGPYDYANEVAQAVYEVFPSLSDYLMQMEDARGFPIDMIQPTLPPETNHLQHYLVAIPKLYRDNPLAWYLPL